MTQHNQLAGIRILVVEDDYYLATDEQQMLQAAGAKVVGPFGNVEDACQAIALGKFDCALVDINLGDGPSFAVAHRLREKGIPFLFTTGYEESVIPEAFRDIGVIEKPTNERAVVAALARLGGAAA